MFFLELWGITNGSLNEVNIPNIITTETGASMQWTGIGEDLIEINSVVKCSNLF